MNGALNPSLNLIQNILITLAILIILISINFKIAINRDTGYFKETLSDSKTSEVGVKSTGTCDLSSNLKKKF